MKQIFSKRFGSFFIVFLRVGAALLLLASVIALPATPVKALSFPAEINKSFTPPAITSGGISTLRVTVYNPNSFPLTQTAWTDNFPLGITISSPLTVTNTCGGSVGAVVGGATLSLSNGMVPLQVGATPGQCYVEVAVTSTTSGNLINTIPASAVTAKGNDGGTIVDITNTTPASATLNVVGVTPPTLAKSFAPNTMYVGGTSVLTVTIKNNDASAQLTETTLTDYLPAGLTLGTPVNAAAPTNCGTGSVTGNPGDTQYTLTNASILAGATCTLQINITSAVQGAYTNTIPAGPGGLGSIHTRQGVTNASPATANLNVQAFTLTKGFAPASIPEGNTSTLTITIRNRANFAYTGVSLFDDLYPYVGNNLEFVGGTATFAACGAMSAAVTNTGAPSTVNNRATFSGGSIAAGATCTITISVRAFQNTPAAAYTNTIPAGRITTTEGATNDVAVSTNLTVTNPLSITKAFAPNSIPLNTNSTLTITISNTSSQPYTITTLTDNLGSPTDSFTSIAAIPNASTTCVGGVVTTGARTVTITGGTIPATPPGSCTITVDVVGTTVGNNRTNRIPAGALGTTQGLSNPANANATISITAPTVTKAFGGGISAGGTQSLTITITNPTGAAALTGLGLVDNLASTGTGLQFTSLTSNSCGGAVTGTGTQVITLTGGALAGGSPAHTCTIVVVVTMPLNTNGGTYTNTIVGTTFTNDQGIGIVGNPTGNITAKAVDLASKTFTPTTIASGGTSSLVITLQNFTTTPLTVNTLTDNMPAQLSVAAYPPATAPSTTCLGGAITAVAGTQLIKLTGGTIPAGTFALPGTCAVTIPVTATLVGGPYTNTIPIGNLTTVEGPSSVTSRSATLTVIAANSPVTLTKTYGTNPIVAGANSLMTLTINAPADTSLTNFSITDTFPTNMVVGNPTGASVVSGCGAAVFSPAVVAGAGSIGISGGTITPGTPCIIRVNVTGNLGGSYINTIHPANITNTEGRTIAADVSQTLNVNTVSTLTVTKSFQSTAVNVNGLSTLTIYLDNSNLSTLINAGLTDTLPGTAADGVRVAPTPNASTTCGAGVITAVAGSGTIIMTNGTIPAKDNPGGTDGLCSIKVDVQGKLTAAALPITYTNTIPTPNVTATNQDTLEVMNSSAPASGTLTITTLTMEVVKKFDPTLVYGGSVSQLSITLRNPNPSAALTGIAFTDTMPQDPAFPGDMTKGMIIATPANFNVGTCGGTLTGTPGTRTLTYSGGMLPASSECVLTLNATMTVNGNLTNTIPIGAVTTYNGVSNTTATSASLTNLAGASLSKAFSPAVIAAGPGNVSTLTITIKNTTSLVLTGVGLVDTLPGILPAGLMIAPAPTPVNNCGGTLTANAGSQNIQLVGGTLTGNSSCTLVLPVTSNTPGVYTNTIPASTLTTNEGASNHEPAVDTLTVTGYSLGNRVWYDTNNNGLLDGAEVGVSGVRVELYQDNGTTPGVWDATDTFIGFATTDASGYYRFDNLMAGDYVVKIPAVNFVSGPLVNYWSSGTSIAANGAVSDSIGPSPNTNPTDSDDNGVTTFTGNTVNYVSAQAVTLGPGANAPTNDNDPATNPQAGEAPNDQSNRTIDFGFYRVELSNQIFVDVNTNGTFDAGDTILSGATVGLYASNGITLLNSVTTGAGGTYLFSGLAAGDYIVKVTPPAGYQSTVDTANSGDTTNPNNNIDNNDNGIGVGAGQVSSNTVTLTPGSVGAAANNVVSNATGTTTNPTLDFGFQRLIYSLGNRVWYDTNNDGLLNNGEVGISGVRVELYEDNGTTPGVYDSGDTFVGFQNTDLNGYYRFDNLPSGNYVVVIPAVNFNSVGAVLAGYLSSGTSITNAGVASDSFGPNPNIDKTDSDDNGVTTFSANAVNYVSTRAVTLGPGSNEPTGETDPAINPLPGEAPDNQSNRTVDFGFYRQLLSDQIFNDLNGNGMYDAGTDSGLSSAIVRLYAGNGSTEIRVGPDGILGTSDDATGGVTTGAAGTYLFSGLPAGQYIVKVLPSAGPSTVDTANPGDTANPNDNIDNNDNGVGTAIGQVSSNRVTLTPGVVGVSTTVANSTGTTSNPSLDFGFVPQYSLGNRVWYDTNNDGLLNNGETGIPGVRVELYHDNGNGIYDSSDTFVGFKTTDANGYYRFDGLDVGSYVVVIPADNFRNIGAGDKVAGDTLAGYLSSGTSIAANGVVTDGIGPNPNINKADNDDNGVTTFNGNVVNYVSAAAVTLGPGVSEPTGETDPVTNPLLGEAPDNQSNRTVDFGFYRQQLGNLIYDDLNPNGTFDAGDTVLSSAVVQLYAANGTTEISVGPDGILGTADDAPGGVTTGVAGTYLFNGLPQGDYVVKVTPPASYKSAVDTANPGDTATPNNNIDNNDNGVGENTGQSASNRFTMTPGAAGVSTTVTNGTGTTYNPSLDFGFVASTTFQFSLGNRIWFDTNNNGLLDSSEVGISGVRVELYLDNGSTPGAYDSGDTFVSFKTTSANGYYRFDGLNAGKYVVVIPTTNFNAGPLAGYWSSGTTLASNGTISDGIGPSPDVNPADSDDNGVTTFSGQTVNFVSARTVTLGPGASEPTGDNDPVTNPEAGEAPNDQSNRTVDFGFYRVDLGNLIFNDANLNGTYDAGDTLLPGAVVQLYASNSSTEINVGPDGILGTADDASGGLTTVASGTYLFSNLPAGNYIVKVTPPAGNESTIDIAKPADTANPNNNVDNNDNGAGTSSGQVSSNPVTLTPGNPGATNSNIITQNTATTINPTLDFGFAPFTGLNKTLINTSETFTTGNDATIGEILTYEITFDLKSGVALNNVTVTDRMQKGLAFVDCLSVNVAGTDVTSTVCPPTVSDFADPGDAGNPANPGRQAVFNIGNISAPSSDTTLVIQYRVIVLDVLENQGGVTLTNNATISYDGSTPITKSAPPVKVVEPKMVINKSAIPNVGVPLGAPVQFTLVINHTSPQSTADAFDVVVKDVLPAELEFIPCSVTYSGWTPTDPLDPAYCIGATTATKDLTFRWDTFPRGQVATINFSARLVGTPATNSASLEWTSLPIDPGITGLPVQLSAHNPRSTERWYDPKDRVNAYGTQSSVTINAPEGSNSGGSGGEGKSASTKKLPATGFAPGIVNDVPVQPSALAYKAYSDLKIEIPSLNVNVDIVGVPSIDDQWDITWLGANAGYLDGTAFPSWLGNSVITGHVYMANGLPGPFVNLSKLKWGDQIVIYAFGQKYIYEVRSALTVSPDNTTVLGHKDQAWVTLLTCKEFDATTGAYKMRTAVQAILVAVVNEVSGAHSGR